MLSVAATLVHIICAVYTVEVPQWAIERKIHRAMQTRNISDDKLLVRELNSLRTQTQLRDDKDKVPPPGPGEKELNSKLLELMRQVMYGTQGRIKSLSPLLAGYAHDPGYRMSFILNRLQQLLIDMRRLYTLAVKWRLQKTVYEQVLWYEYCAHKYVDVLYVVEHALQEHGANLNTFNSMGMAVELTRS